MESILLVTSGPVSFKKLADLSGSGAGEVKECLLKMNSEYKGQDRGWHVTLTDKEAQLVTNPANASWVEKAVKQELKEDLTPAALETLAIVAYKGPLKKPEIDFIRGVNCAYTLRSLMVRGLVSREADSKDSRTFSYSVTPDLLNFLGVSTVSELPEYRETMEKLEEMKKEFMPPPQLSSLK